MIDALDLNLNIHHVTTLLLIIGIRKIHVILSTLEANIVKKSCT